MTVTSPVPGMSQVPRNAGGVWSCLDFSFSHASNGFLTYTQGSGPRGFRSHLIVIKPEATTHNQAF